ncbi:lysine-specific demethylase 7B isoform X5 [Hydra vulgaris]|uniref:Lysine-specific demethylase 7B isoform X5 n=1 Tax=Hydra vulgaris TaxID=6087 RepID=A0ABM4DII9_HYDVU
MTSMLYCVCNKEYEEGQFMIECGKCGEWFHGSCVGIEEYQAQDIEEYHCTKCELVHGPLVLKKRRNVSQHNYKEIHEGTKQISAGSVMFIRQLKTKKFIDCKNVIRFLNNGNSFDVNYLQQHGFDVPILVKEKTGLGLVVPPSNFTVYDVEKRVGPLFDLHVIDVAKQEDLRMKMREWTEYFNSPIRGRVLNVISLEFSKTSLNELVTAPEIVRNMSWVENTWPKVITEENSHTPPAVMKYCLMGVKDCYTDFHVDFGGTSVWYHLLHGEKVFYFIEPTKVNLKKFEQWASSSDQNQVFFGDKVDKCYKISLQEGNTIFIPSGWIHAVLTPKDSLVFGGNFLQTFSISQQLSIYYLEKRLMTPLKFLFPNFETSNWYAAQAILKKMKDIHGAGYKIPSFLLDGVQDLIVALKQWISKKDEFTKFHKLQIPADINPSKLIKALEKEVKEDVNKKDAFPDSLLSPAYMSPVQMLKLKIKKSVNETSKSSSDGDSDSEKSLNDDSDTEKSMTKRRKKRRLCGKNNTPSKSIDLPIKQNIKTVFNNDSNDDSIDHSERSYRDLKMNFTNKTLSVLNDEDTKVGAIKLRLSLPSIKTGNDLYSTIENASSRIKDRSKTDIKEEIEAAKRDTFMELDPAKTKLFFSTKPNVDDPTVKPVTFALSKPSQKKSSSTNIQCENNVKNTVPKKEIKKTKKRSNSESGSDYDPSIDNYYQDEDYVYPRIDVTSDLNSDDFSWRPGQRKPSKIVHNKKKKNNIPADHSKPCSENFFPSDEDLSNHVDDLKESKQEFTKPAQEKPKKGFATAKQRLGKLLNLHKTGSRYIRK